MPSDPTASVGTFDLVIYEERSFKADQLEVAVRGDRRIQIVRKPARELWYHSGLDAIYVSIPMAEKWGARPQLYEIQILPTTDVDLEQGLPPYVIAGIATDGDERHASADMLGIILRITFEGIARFNSKHPPTPIRTVGFMPQHLLADELDGSVIGEQLLREIAQIQHSEL
jgi:hypothetical protein